LDALNDRPSIVIAGGGVAAVELALALHDLAGDRVRPTLVAPQPDFELRALRTAEPFSADHMRRHSLRELADRVGAELVPDTVIAVAPDRREVRLARRGTLGYDTLVVAVGARRRPAFSRAITFTGDMSSVQYNGLLADLEEGWSRSVAFVVPANVTWPLPMYELALMTARAVDSMGIDDVRLQLISPERSPLELFGQAASGAVAELLDAANITFTGDSQAQARADGRLELLPDGTPVDAERIVALPTMDGPQILGIPGDGRGFIPVDDHCRVVGLADVYAAGDGTTFPVKQGGLACQQADAVAEQIAAAAGADVDPQPFKPVLRGRLLIGRGAQYLEQALDGDAERESRPPELQLWSAPHKVEGRYLTPWLQELDGDVAASPAADGEHIDVEAPL
jgi:sulfide:quinone oxidoreductase